MSDSADSQRGTEHGLAIVDPDDCDDTIHCECAACGLSGEVPARWEGLTIECRDCGERRTVEEAEA